MEVELTITGRDIEPTIVAMCHIGEHVNIWTNDDVHAIFFYSRRTCGGLGCVGRIQKSRMPVFSTHWRDAKAQILEADGTTVVILCTFEATEAELKGVVAPP